MDTVQCSKCKLLFLVPEGTVEKRVKKKGDIVIQEYKYVCDSCKAEEEGGDS